MNREKIITPEDIRAVLTEDNFSRKHRRWDLINYEGLLGAYKIHNGVKEINNDIRAINNHDGYHRDVITIKKTTIAVKFCTISKTKKVNINALDILDGLVARNEYAKKPNPIQRAEVEWRSSRPKDL